MPPSDDEQRRREMAASFGNLHLHPPIPPTPKPNHPIPISVPLSVDVLTEILVRLQPKSVIRSKLVCKEWFSLISSDWFGQQYNLRRPKLLLQHSGRFSDPDYFCWNPTSINANGNGGENAVIPYTLSLPPHHHYQIQQACNGLLLLTGSNTDDWMSIRVYRCVYNPTTKLSTEINVPTYKDEGNHVAGMALAFDPSKSPYYKIVCLRPRLSSDYTTYTHRVEVYDSESRTWKLCLEAFTPPSNFNFSRALYWNNAILWWDSANDSHTFYYCFDIAKNEMKTLHFPLCRYDRKRDSYLQELDGRLYYLTLSFSRGGPELWVVVWELGGDDEWLFRHNRVFPCDGIGKFVRLMGDSEDLVVGIYHQSGEVEWEEGIQMEIEPRAKMKMEMMKMKAYSLLHKRCEDLVELTAPPHDTSDVWAALDYGQVFVLKAFEFRETQALL